MLLKHFGSLGHVAVLLRGSLAPWAALFVIGSAEVAATQPTLSNQGFGQIYQFPLLSMKFGLGSEWIF